MNCEGERGEESDMMRERIFIINDQNKYEYNRVTRPNVYK